MAGCFIFIDVQCKCASVFSLTLTFGATRRQHGLVRSLTARTSLSSPRSPKNTLNHHDGTPLTCCVYKLCIWWLILITQRRSSISGVLSVSPNRTLDDTSHLSAGWQVNPAEQHHWLIYWDFSHWSFFFQLKKAGWQQKWRKLSAWWLQGYSVQFSQTFHCDSSFECVCTYR